MKRFLPLLFLTILVLGAGTVEAQTQDQPWSLDLEIGSHAYDGDLGNELLGTSESDFLWSIGLSKYLSPSWDLGFSAAKMELDYVNPANSNDPAIRGTRFKTSNFQLNLMTRFKFNNGSILREDLGVKPYLTAGIGVNVLKHENGTNSGAFAIPFGAGVSYELSDKVSLNYQITYNRTFSDNLDTYPQDAGEFTNANLSHTNIDGKDHDDFLTNTIGIRLRFGGGDQTSQRMQMHRHMMEEMQATRQAAEGAQSAAQNSYEVSQENRELNEQTLQAIEELSQDRGMTAQVSQDLRDMLLNILNNIEFGYDSSEILANAEDDLELLAEVMTQYEDLRVSVEGHADSRGSEDYNMALSQRRADAVRQFLIDEGVSGNRITATALGESSPELTSGDQETVYGQNRYVRLTFSYAGGS
ncbi:MAG: DUF6089 family protein [Balneolaceae bacterium]|nr:DUF6089 family protein [Balneolaceae bacterium]